MTDQTPSTEQVREKPTMETIAFEYASAVTDLGWLTPISKTRARFEEALASHERAIRADELRKALAELRAAEKYLAAQGLDLTADAVLAGIETRLADLEGDDHA